MTENSGIRTRASMRLQNKPVLTETSLPTPPRKSIRPPRKTLKPPKPVKLKEEVVVEDEPQDLLIGREIELESIRNYIRQFLSAKSGSIYISGAPGTGKTASVLQVIRGLQSETKMKHFLLNCMKLDSPQSILREIAKNLNGSFQLKGSIEEQFDKLEELFTLQKIPLVIILDEIDQLASRHHQMLYRIFDWPKNITEKMIIIGIANSLDLTERLLPKLFTSSFRPHHIAFAPYNPQEIARILHERLMNHAKNVTFDNFAIQMCSRNVSASSGDLRKAFTICYRALDIARQEAKTAEKENDAELKVNVSIKHVKSAIREAETAGDVLQQAISGVEGEQGNFPLHHKLILASLVLLKNRRASSEFPLGLLHETYQSVCQSQKISPVSMSDYTSICDLMDSRGLVRISIPGPKSQALSTPSRLKKIALKLDVKGVTAMMDDQFLLSSIMDMQI